MKKEAQKSVSDLGNATVEKVDSACTEVKCDLPDSSRTSNMDSSADPKGKVITPSRKKKGKKSMEVALQFLRKQLLVQSLVEFLPSCWWNKIRQQLLVPMMNRSQIL